MSLPEQLSPVKRRSKKRHNGGHDSHFPLTAPKPSSLTHEDAMLAMAERQIDFLCQGWELNLDDIKARFPDAWLHIEAMTHPDVFTGILCQRMWSRLPVAVSFIRHNYPVAFANWTEYMRSEDKIHYGVESFDVAKLMRRCEEREEEQKKQAMRFC